MTTQNVANDLALVVFEAVDSEGWAQLADEVARIVRDAAQRLDDERLRALRAMLTEGPRG